MAFVRRFPDAAIKELEATDLFRECLRPDIVERSRGRIDRGRDVFPAVRNGRMDFYYKGGKLFSYSKRSGFTTHHKYASVIRGDSRRPYVTDKNFHAIKTFKEGYERIKENCSHYSGVEAQGISEVYGKFSCAKNHRSNTVVVLDIEISLRRDGEGKEAEPGTTARANSDRIDLLFLDTESGILRFFEAKDYSNDEIRAKQGYEPRIVKQMLRYEKQLDRVSEEILEGYQAYVEVINKLFKPEPPLPTPLAVDPIPRLLIFGFDMEQQEKLKLEVKRLEEEYGHSIYHIGNIKQVNQGTLFSGGRKGWS
jgi:hypothetical protein